MKPLPRFKWDIDSTSHWRRWINIPRFPPPPHSSQTPSSFISLQRTPDETKREGVTQSTLPINFQKTAFGCPGFSFPAVLLKLHNYCVQPEKTHLRFEFSDTKTCGVWHGKSTGHPSGEGVGNSSLKFNLSFGTGNRKSTVKPVLADLIWN